MKAITLHQPWASLIADIRKPVETRPRPWYYIGDVAIHAGLHVDWEACKQFGYDPETIPCGAVLCIAHKDGCTQFPSVLITPDAFGDYSDGRYGYLLSNIRKLKAPVPARGKQGFWEWDAPYDIQVESQQTS